MAVLSASHLTGHDLHSNAGAILAATDGTTWRCICSNDAMEKLFGAGHARDEHIETIEGVNVTFVNWMDATA